MTVVMWVLIAIAVLIVLLAILAFFMTKGKKTKPDYYAMFMMGIVWMPFGVIMNNIFFWVMGAAFMAIGLLNRDKWKENRKDFKKMDKKDKMFFYVIMAVLGVLVLVGIVFFFLVEKGVILGNFC